MAIYAPNKYITTLELKDIPKGTTILDLTGCINLKNLPENLPNGIKDLYLIGCTSLKNLPDNLPNGIESLNLTGCTSLENLPDNLPDGITILSLTGCTSLKNLPENLPEGITFLSLIGCTSLKTLPETLPDSIENLNLFGCTSLQNTMGLIAQLEELEEKNVDNPDFRLIWPDHLDRSPGVTELKQLLIKAYKEYYKSNPDFKDKEPDIKDNANYPTLFLLHRFMSESLVDRGGLKKILNSILPFAKTIAENPHFLEFIDESSKIYLDACVNQPVAGFGEIVLLVEIIKQTDILSKLDIAKIIMATNLIKEEVVKLKIGSLVEVELGNAMIREVHNELLKDKVIDKDKPWPGIPEGIAYESSIKSHLTENNIKNISGIVKNLFSKLTSLKVADFLCEGSLQDFWAKMVLTKEDYQKLNEPLEAIKEKFMNLEDQTGEEGLKLAQEIKEAELNCRKSILKKSKEKTSDSIKKAEQQKESVKEMPNLGVHYEESFALKGYDKTVTKNSFLTNIKEILSSSYPDIRAEDHGMWKPQQSFEEILVSELTKNGSCFNSGKTRLNDNIKISDEFLREVKNILNDKYPESKSEIDKINSKSFETNKVEVIRK